MVEENKSNSTRDFLLFILFLVILSILWYAQGGLERDPGEPFLKQSEMSSDYYIKE